MENKSFITELLKDFPEQVCEVFSDNASFEMDKFLYDIYSMSHLRHVWNMAVSGNGSLIDVCPFDKKAKIRVSTFEFDGEKTIMCLVETDAIFRWDQAVDMNSENDVFSALKNMEFLAINALAVKAIQQYK